MSFLNQLKLQANALQREQSALNSVSDVSIQLVEAASKSVWLYLSEVAKQLNVIEPTGPPLVLDKRVPWPEMKLVDFRVDARKKKLIDREVYDYVSMGWRIVPRDGAPLPGSVSANFPPDLQRIEARLAAGAVKHDRIDVRHPEKNTLQAIRFDYSTEARGGITVTAEHGTATMSFRLMALQGFEVANIRYSAKEVETSLMDELAKLVVGQPSRFV